MKYGNVVQTLSKYLSLVVAQRSSDEHGNTSSNLCFLYNWIYIILVFVLYVTNCYTMTDKLGVGGYSFISRISFCCNTYLTPSLACYINIVTFFNRKKISQCFLNRATVLSECEHLGLNIEVVYSGIGVLLFIQIAIIVSFLVWDLWEHASQFSVIFWLVAYLPGVTIVTYFVEELLRLEHFRLMFRKINTHLEKFTTIENIKRSCIKPKRKTVGAENIFDNIFSLHNLTWSNCKSFNDLWGYPFLFIIGASFAIWLSALYNIIMDVRALLHDRPTMTRSVYAHDLWAIAYAIIIVAFLEICEDLAQISKYTLTTLHKLLSIYPDFQEEGEMHALNLLNEQLSLTAAGYFTLQRPLLLEILSTQATYFIVLMQLDNQLNN